MRSLACLLAVCSLALFFGTSEGYIFGNSCPDWCAQSVCPRSGCSSCQDGYYVLYNIQRRYGICVTDCPDGYYENFFPKWCIQCPDKCRLCENNHRCKTCEDGYDVTSYGQCRRTRIW